MSNKLSSFKLPLEYVTKKSSIKKDVSDDVELKEGKNPLYHRLFNATDDFKKLIIDQYPLYHSTDTNYIRDTQTILKGSLPPTPIYDDMMTIRSKLTKETEDFVDKYGYIAMEKLSFLNKHSTAMQCMSIYHITSPVLSLALPIFMLIIPFFMIRLQGISLTGANYYELMKQLLKNHSVGRIFNIANETWDKRVMIIVSFIFYIIQVYFNFQSCINFVSNMQQIHSTIFTVRDYLNDTIASITHIQDQWAGIDTYKPFIDKCVHVKSVAQDICGKLCKISDCKVSISKILDIGLAMQAFYMINSDEEYLETMDYCLKFNCYINNLSVLQSKLTSKEISFSKNGTHTKFSDIYYPHLSKENPVKNNINLTKNRLITGPNAAGKTTLLKSIIINIILTQQFGCGFYKKCTINPYDIIHSYINIPDTSGRDSLFQAEAIRCKHILDDINSNYTLRHFCIFDELFSGTNPYEAIGAATAYLKYLNKYNRVTYVITTHFLDLCKQFVKDNMVKNSQMQVTINNGDFVYNYKMVDGISTIKGGMKVLRDLNYPEEIILTGSTIINNMQN